MPSRSPDHAAGTRDAGVPRGLHVRIPSLLHSYTAGASTVRLAAHATLDEALRDLDARFPGLRFRVVDEQGAIRPHIKMFVDGDLARRIDTPIGEAGELMIVGALSGG